jgi:hypothetical protein
LALMVSLKIWSWSLCCAIFVISLATSFACMNWHWWVRGSFLGAFAPENYHTSLPYLHLSCEVNFCKIDPVIHFKGAFVMTQNEPCELKLFQLAAAMFRDCWSVADSSNEWGRRMEWTNYGWRYGLGCACKYAWVEICLSPWPWGNNLFYVTYNLTRLFRHYRHTHGSSSLCPLMWKSHFCLSRSGLITWYWLCTLWQSSNQQLLK